MSSSSSTDTGPLQENTTLYDRASSQPNYSATSSTFRRSSATPIRKAGCLPRRILVTALACIGMTIVNSMRVNLSITMVILLERDNTDPQMMKEESNHSIRQSTDDHQDLPVLDWDHTRVGVLHSIFYVGFLLTQLPGGYICTKQMPGNRILGASILASCAFNLFLPLAISELGYYWTCGVRVIQGLAEGLSHPALYAIIRDWAPKSEKSTVAAICLAGVYAGPIIGFPLVGALSHYLGWQYSYYIQGALGHIWFLSWFLIVSESPDTDPNISEEELQLIVLDRDVPPDHVHPIPWINILCSAPVWAIVVCHFAVSWIFFLMLTNEPMYLDKFHFTILENGIYSSLPHVMKVSITSFSGFIADKSLQDGVVSRTFIRKLYTVVGLGFEALCLYCLIFIDEGHIAVIILTAALGISGLAVSGWQISHLDIAPNYASVLIALSTTVGTIGGILSPIIVGIITKENTLKNWQKSFIVTATVIMTAAVTYFIFGSADLQPWADQCKANPESCKELQQAAEASTKSEEQTTELETATSTPNR